MGYKNILIWLVSFLIFMGAFSLIYSLTTDFSVENFSKTIFSSIYNNANTSIQSELINTLNENCLYYSGETQDKFAPSLLELCNNQTLLQQIKTNCQNYYQLKSSTQNFNPDVEFEKACSDLTSGAIENSCKTINSKEFNIDKNKLLPLCNSYTNNNLDNKTFFVETLSTFVPTTMSEESAALLKTTNMINTISIALLAPLVILLFILQYHNKKQFVISLSKTVFSLGIVITIPILILKAYAAIVGYDTSAIIASMQYFGTEPVYTQTSQLIGVIPLVLSEILGKAFLITGIIILIIGILLRIVFKKEKELETIE